MSLWPRPRFPGRAPTQWLKEGIHLRREFNPDRGETWPLPPILPHYICTHFGTQMEPEKNLLISNAWSEFHPIPKKCSDKEKSRSRALLPSNPRVLASPRTILCGEAPLAVPRPHTRSHLGPPKQSAPVVHEQGPGT